MSGDCPWFWAWSCWCWSFSWRRLVTLQVFGSADWNASAVENYTKNLSSAAARGIIYDRNGFVLARNVASYNITITPASVPDDDADVQRIYRALSDLTGVPVNKGTLDEAKLYAPCVEGPGITQLVDLGDSLAPYSPVEIKCNVSEEVARLVQEHGGDWPGVAVEVNPIRDYPTGSLTAAVIGYLGPIPAALEQVYRDRGFVPNRDKVGYAGIELSLRGNPGRAEWEARGPGRCGGKGTAKSGAPDRRGAGIQRHSDD